MNTIKISATHARNNFFEVLGWVESGKNVIVEKDKKEIAVIIPKKTQKTDLKGLKKLMSELHGVEKDFDLSKSPLRGKRSKKWLEKIRSY